MVVLEPTDYLDAPLLPSSVAVTFTPKQNQLSTVWLLSITVHSIIYLQPSSQQVALHYLFNHNSCRAQEGLMAPNDPR